VFELTTKTGGLAGELLDGPRDELFSVDGKVYTIPVEFPPMVGFNYITVQRRYGDEVAVSWAMELALGAEGLEALTGADVPNETFAKLVAIIIGRIQGLAMHVPGATAAPKAPKTATRKAKAS
jgi:hypothetical protein